MPDEQKTQLRLEIAHVPFMDIVGYSKLLSDEQSEDLQELNEIVRKTDAVRAAEAAGWIRCSIRSATIRGSKSLPRPPRKNEVESLAALS